MTAVTSPARRADDIARELDQARRRGPLQQIVVPPWPELLARLHQVLATAEPDLGEVARVGWRGSGGD